MDVPYFIKEHPECVLLLRKHIFFPKKVKDVIVKKKFTMLL